MLKWKREFTYPHCHQARRHGFFWLCASFCGGHGDSVVEVPGKFRSKQCRIKYVLLKMTEKESEKNAAITAPTPLIGQCKRDSFPQTSPFHSYRPRLNLPTPPPANLALDNQSSSSKGTKCCPSLAAGSRLSPRHGPPASSPGLATRPPSLALARTPCKPMIPTRQPPSPTPPLPMPPPSTLWVRGITR